jgi:hypothetical protein
MAAVRYATVAVKAPVALFILSSVLFLALLASCGGADTRMETGAPAVPQSAAEPALLSLKPGRAVLIEGTVPVRGLPGFGRNALAALSGAYAIASAETVESFRVAVWFTREILVKPEDWTTPQCKTPASGFTLLAAPREADGSSLWSLWGNEYVLLIQVPTGFPEPCGFITKFASRFSFFYRYAGQPEDVSFPSIVELSE